MSAPPNLPISGIPQPLRPLAHFVKIANEYANRDIIIYYWCLLKAVEDAMKMDSTSAESKQFLVTLMNILEQVKQANKDNDAIMQDVVAQSHIEDQAQRLFQYAYSQDEQKEYNQKMIKAFYTCGYLFDVLGTFGPLDDNIQSARKYAKWRATHIYASLKEGVDPTPGGSIKQENGNVDNFEDELSAELNALNTSISGHHRQPQTQGNQSGQGVPSQPHPSYGAYPNIGQHQSPPQQPTAYSGPKPGLQEPFARPAGFSSYQPANKTQSNPAIEQAKPAPTSHLPAAQPAQNLKLEDYLEAKKYTKYASSAMDYEDPKTAIDYLQKAIAVLRKQTPP